MSVYLIWSRSEKSISNLENETFEFCAVKNIQPNEEIFTYYGGVEYWEDGRTKTNVV